ncbi:MAG: hypothetical protein JNJ57_01310 [Saprospiraceae bacterium]|nr:hypothetical protein [Saprospiraceae bacterium]
MSKLPLHDPLPPLLNELKNKEDGFHVPDHYFETFENRLFERLEQSGIERPQELQSFKVKTNKISRYFPVMAIAAAFTVLIAAFWFFQSNVLPTDNEIASTELTEDEIESYVLDNLHDFETEQLAMLPSEEELDIVPPSHAPSTSPDSIEDIIAPEDVESILNDMTEEELEEIL